MILLIDAGNTRIKWGLIDGGRWVDRGILDHEEAFELGLIAQAHGGLAQAYGSNVAGATVGTTIEFALHGASVTLEWLQVTPQQCGVQNLYDTPAQLGADRWAALIGARSLHRHACLIVTAGTATTVDVLDTDGQFRGGLILPGEDMMRRALADNTAQLALAEGCFTPNPRNTADAIVSGCLSAQIGAIRFMFEHIEHEPGALCLLNGGGAARLEPLLTIPLERTDNLVLTGLSVVAQGCTPTSD